MHVSEKRAADVVVLSVTGKIDHNSADAFRDAVMQRVEALAETLQALVLDLSGVEYMSSVGLRALMLSAKRSKELERKVVVAGLNDTMREIFEISRFNLVFDVFDDVETALATLDQAALDAYRS